MNMWVSEQRKVKVKVEVKMNMDEGVERTVKEKAKVVREGGERGARRWRWRGGRGEEGQRMRR